MKQVIGTFFTYTAEDFSTFTKMYEDAGYEVAKQSNTGYQAVVIAEVDETEVNNTIGVKAI